MAAIQDPKPALHALLTGIYGRSVAIQPAPKFEPSAVKACTIAVYANNQSLVVGMLVCSLTAAGYMAAALALLPRSVADESIKKGALDESLLENFREVANICSTLFIEYVHSRVHLETVIAKAVAPPPEYNAFMQSAARTDVTIDVPNYGVGPVSIGIGKSTGA